MKETEEKQKVFQATIPTPGGPVEVRANVVFVKPPCPWQRGWGCCSVCGYVAGQPEAVDLLQSPRLSKWLKRRLPDLIEEERAAFLAVLRDGRPEGCNRGG